MEYYVKKLKLAASTGNDGYDGSYDSSECVMDEVLDRNASRFQDAVMDLHYLTIWHCS